MGGRDVENRHGSFHRPVSTRVCWSRTFSRGGSRFNKYKDTFHSERRDGGVTRFWAQCVFYVTGLILSIGPQKHTNGADEQTRGTKTESRRRPGEVKNSRSNGPVHPRLGSGAWSGAVTPWGSFRLWRSAAAAGRWGAWCEVSFASVCSWLWWAEPRRRTGPPWRPGRRRPGWSDPLPGCNDPAWSLRTRGVEGHAGSTGAVLYENFLITQISRFMILFICGYYETPTDWK